MQKLNDMIIKILSIFILLSTMIFTSCNDCADDEIWHTRVDLEDGSYIFVFHSSNCEINRPFLRSPKTKKINFEKYKYYVYDFCIDENDVMMLDAISYRNIKNFLDNALDYAEDLQDYEYYFKIEQIIDTLPRLDIYDVCYSLSTDGELVKLEQPTNVFILLEKEYETLLHKKYK